MLSNPCSGSASAPLAPSGPCSATGPKEACEDTAAAVAPRKLYETVKQVSLGWWLWGDGFYADSAGFGKAHSR